MAAEDGQLVGKRQEVAGKLAAELQADALLADEMPLSDEASVAVEVLQAAGSRPAGG